MKKVSFVLGLALLTACSSNDNAASTPDSKIITQNDFESTAGWSVDPAMLYRGKAHSGQYALKVDKDHEFSLTFDSPLSLVSPTRIKKVHLEAWALLASEKSTGVLGIQVMEPTTNAQVYSGGIELGKQVKSRGKWEKVEADYELPATITAEQHIRLSLWRADAVDQVLVDDVKLSVQE